MGSKFTNDITNMRLKAEKLKLLKKIENLQQQSWFDSMISKAQEAGHPLSNAELRFIVSIRKIVEDGWKIDENLFKDVRNSIIQ